MVDEVYHKQFLGNVSYQDSLTDIYINSLGVSAVCVENGTTDIIRRVAVTGVNGKVGDDVSVAAPFVPGWDVVAGGSPKIIQNAALSGNTVHFYYTKATPENLGGGSTIVIYIHNLEDAATGSGRTSRFEFGAG